MKHQISLVFQGNAVKKFILGRHLRRCIRAVLESEGENVPCEINVMVADDATIRAINRQTRDIDQPTDVLSFPMFEYTPEAFPADVSADIDPETGLLPLGDMVISLERGGGVGGGGGRKKKKEVVGGGGIMGGIRSGVGRRCV